MIGLSESLLIAFIVSSIAAMSKAHQDDDSKSTLLYEVEMNITADKLAMELLREHHTTKEDGPIQNSAHFDAMQASRIIKEICVHSGAGCLIRTSIQTKQ